MFSVSFNICIYTYICANEKWVYVIKLHMLIQSPVRWSKQTNGKKSNEIKQDRIKIIQITD